MHWNIQPFLFLIKLLWNTNSDKYLSVSTPRPQKICHNQIFKEWLATNISSGNRSVLNFLLQTCDSSTAMPLADTNLSGNLNKQVLQRGGTKQTLIDMSTNEQQKYGACKYSYP